MPPLPDALRRRLAGRTPSFTVRAMASSTGVSIVYAGVAFVVNILMSRLLGPSSRGHVAIVLQCAYVLAPVVTLGLDRQALRGGAALPPAKAYTWIVSAPIAVVGLALGRLEIALCAVVAASLAAVNIERSDGMARASLSRFLVLAVAVQTWILAASAGLYLAGVEDVRWWMAVYAAPAPVLLLVEVVSSRRGGPRTRPSRTSLTYMVGGVASMLAGRVDRLILPIVSSTRQLGLYLAVATASELVAWAAKGRGESRVSGFTTSTLSRGQAVRVFAKDVVIFAAASAVVGVGILYLLLPVLGPQFDDARRLVVPLCVAAVSWCLYLQLSSWWLGTRSSAASAAFDLTTAALTAAAVAFLGSQHGALGAAWACFGAYSLMCVAALALGPRSGPRTT